MSRKPVTRTRPPHAPPSRAEAHRNVHGDAPVNPHGGSHGGLNAWDNAKPTALLVLADGTVLEGFRLGAPGHAVGEVCFNTAMTGYQEILDRSVLCRPDHHLHLPPYRR